MCGIIAGISINNKILKILIDGLKQLQNRGYDSAGICSIFNNNFILKKYASDDNNDSIKMLENNLNLDANCNIGIGHTRWATHGGKTQINSHPHVSFDDKISLVHNGIIENYETLKKELISKGIKFKSQTDSEIIVNLIAYYYDKTNNMIKSIKKTINRLEGTWGIVIMNIDEPNKLYAVRHGSPLLVSTDEDQVIITSEQSGFHGLVNNYFVLDKNDICVVENKNSKISLSTLNKYIIKNTTSNDFKLTPEPYPHWTIKEIMDQYESSLRAISMGGRLMEDDNIKLGGLEENKKILKRINNLIILGCGTSLNAGKYALSFFKNICKFNTVTIYDGAEFNIDDIPKIGSSCAIVLSQSGETADLINCLSICKEEDIFLIGVVNVVDSLIAREVDCGCYLNAGREVGVGSTKSFTNQCIILTMIALWFSNIHKTKNNLRKKMISDLRKLPLDIKNTLDNLFENTTLMRYSEILNKNNLFVLGKGKSSAIASEGALKIKELSYIHAEGYSSSSLKHGPFALLDDNVPVILLASSFNFYDKTKNAYKEIESRNSQIIFITNKDEEIKNKILIPTNETFQDLLFVIPLQFFSYYLSINKNIDVDKPRNLAKCVTVE